MGRGPKKHMKRINAPSHWMLDKLGGIYAPKPTPGPHKTGSCIPLQILLQNRLRYCMNATEVKKIVLDKAGSVKIDNKTRKDVKFPCGIMDVVSIEKTGEFFRILFDVKGRFQPHKIDAKEATFKLCKIVKKGIHKSKVPFCVTNDGRTIRYQHPDIKVNDTIKLSLETGEILDWYKYEQGNVAIVIGGSNKGRVGTVSRIEKHDASFNIVHMIDGKGGKFATRVGNMMVIGRGKRPAITLFKDKGIKRGVIEEKKMKGNFMDFPKL
jgi:small subunit ribosomal protein S4e